MKARVPAAHAPTSRAVMAALGVDAAALARAEYTLDELIDELVVPSAELRGGRACTSGVSTTRSAAAWPSCSEVRTAEGARRTIAVESEDPALVIAAVRELGLGSRRNVSFPRGLKSLVGFGAQALRGHRRRHELGQVPHRASGARTASGSRSSTAPRSRAWAKASNETGRLGAKPIERTVAAIAGMAEEATREGVEAIAAVGTAGLRIAPTAPTSSTPCATHAGVEVEVIPGEEEARLAYLAAKSGLGLGDGSLVVFDTGGGSSQFTFGHGDRVDERFSVNVGRRRGSRSATASTGRVGRPAGSGARRDRRRPRATRRPARARHAGRDGRRHHEPHRRQARARDLRPRRRARHASSTAARSTARSSCTARAPPSSAARSSGCSPSARRSSSPARASCAPCSPSSAANRSP